MRLIYFLTTLVGSIIGAGMAGFLESIVLTLREDCEYLTLPFAALGYYGLAGVLFGILLGIVFTLFYMGAGGNLSRKIVLGISAGTTATYYILFIYEEKIRAVLGMVSYSVIQFLTISLIILIIFWMVYYFISLLYSLLSSISKYPVSALFILYLLIWGLSGIVAAYSPRISRIDKHYDSSLSTKVEDKPNILLIIVDALRYDTISPYGYDVKTPSMQRLADDGILFTNAIANCYWTKPAMASIFSSLMPKKHRVLQFWIHMPEDIPVLADELSNYGYFTVGLSTNPNITRETRFDRGFNEFHYYQWVYTAIPRDNEAPGLELYRKYNSGLIYIFPSLKKRIRPYYNAELTTNAAINWLKKNGNRRFFMYLHYMDPHMPYYKHPYNGDCIDPLTTVGDADDVDYYSSLYKQEIEYTDEHLSRLLQYITTSGLYDSTIIILTADHGEEFYDHYAWDHVMSLYDELIHIPLIIKLPDSKQAGTVDSSLVNQIDYAPTILNLAGLECPDEWDGKNIFDADYHYDCIISQFIGIVSIRTTKYKWMYTGPEYSITRLQEKRLAKIDKKAAFPENNLFDLIYDPGEKQNLYKAPEAEPILRSLSEMVDTSLVFISPDTALFKETDNLQRETIERLKALGYLQ